MGTMALATRFEAVGKRVIQTRWVDRQKDGRVKLRLVLKDNNPCQGATQPEMLAASSPEREHNCDVHTAFLHADVDQDMFAQPPEPDEWCDAALRDDEVWKLNKALFGYRQAPKLWHQYVVRIL